MNSVPLHPPTEVNSVTSVVADDVLRRIRSVRFSIRAGRADGVVDVRVRNILAPGKCGYDMSSHLPSCLMLSAITDTVFTIRFTVPAL